MPDYQKLYKESCDKIMPYIRLEGRAEGEFQDPQTEAGKQFLREGAEGLKRIIELNPEHWPSWFMLGKAYQAWENWENAYQALLRAHKLAMADDQADNSAKGSIMKDLACECLHTKRFDDATYYSQAALAFCPADDSLYANMAVAKLFQGNLDDAEKWAKKCLEILPDDEPSTVVLKIVADVRAGKREIPTDFSVLERDGP